MMDIAFIDLKSQQSRIREKIEAGWQQVLEHDRDVRKSQRPRRPDVFEVAPTQEFGTHDINE